MAKKTWTKEEVERVLARSWGEPSHAGGPQVGDVLQALPPDVDPALAGAKVVEILVRNPWFAGRRCKRLPESVIADVLARIDARTAAPWAAFVHAHVGSGRVPDELVAAWGKALEALLDLNTSYAFGSKEQVAKLAKVAADPRGLEAARAVAASRSSRVPWTILGVLVMDGGEASIDALLPYFSQALESRDASLDLLVELERHATPRVKELLASARAAKVERTKSSPATDLARRLFGKAAPAKLDFSVHVGSHQENASHEPEVRANVTIDSDAPTAFNVFVVRHSLSTLFDAARVRRDELELGRASLEELPAFLARVAARQTISWNWDGAQARSNLRGKRRDAVLAWLRGA